MPVRASSEHFGIQKNVHEISYFIVLFALENGPYNLLHKEKNIDKEIIE